MTYDFFTAEELTCHCGCGQDFMDEFFMKKLVILRRRLGFALPVTSGFRCPNHNALVSTTGEKGPHTKGLAVDIHITHDLATKLISAALNSGFMGIGIRQHGALSTRIVHIDIVPRLSQIIWTY